MMSQQKLERKAAIKIRKGYNTKTIKNKKFYVLQGLPGIGPKLAKQLLEHFGYVEKVMCSSKEQLCQTQGIGKIMAEKIIDVVQS